MLTNRITSYESTTTVDSVQVQTPSIFSIAQIQPGVQSQLALQIIAMQQAYEQALQGAREEARQLFALQLQSSLN